MPKGVMATESCSILGSIRLHALAPSEITDASGRLSSIPLATVFSDDMVEESAEDVLSPACISVVGVVGRAEMERRTLAC